MMPCLRERLKIKLDSKYLLFMKINVNDIFYNFYGLWLRKKKCWCSKYVSMPIKVNEILIVWFEENLFRSDVG